MSQERIGIVEFLNMALAVSAILYARRQFTDAQQHKTQLKTIAETLRTETSNLEGVITKLRTSVDEVHSHSKRIKEAVFTSPPDGFATDFCKWATLIHTYLVRSLPRTTDPTVTKEKLEALIQRMLVAVAGLAGSYDVGRDARYAANIMIFVPRAKTAPYFGDFSDDQIRQFLHDDYALERLHGILLLATGLSAVANSDGGPDEDLEQIIFGIPATYQKGDRWTIPPGAPKTFVKWNREPDSLLIEAASGTDDIRHYFQLLNSTHLGDEEFEIDPAVILKLLRYYRETRPGQRVVSFQSYPLIDSSSAGNAFGVLNIHCDKEVFLGGPGEITPIEARKRHDTFASFIAPIVFEISNVVKLWTTAAHDTTAEGPQSELRKP